MNVYVAIMGDHGRAWMRECDDGRMGVLMEERSKVPEGWEQGVAPA
jgi:hypothetical protein